MTCSRSADLSSERMPWLALRVVMKCKLPPEASYQMAKLDGKKIAILVANEGIEQVELTEPRKALEDAGATTELLAPEAGEAQAFNHLDKADAFPGDKTARAATAGDWDGLLLPGGGANPDQRRAHQPAVKFIRAFFDAGKPVA